MNKELIANLEKKYSEYEKVKTEAKEKQDLAKQLKEEIIETMTEMGRDEVIVNGWDGLVKLEITFPEREVLNKKSLAEAIGVSQKELSNPQSVSELTRDGKLTPEIIQQYIEPEERMQFSAKEFQGEEEELGE